MKQEMMRVAVASAGPYAPRSRQIPKPEPHHSTFYRLGALPDAQLIVSKHWRQPMWID